MRLFGHSLTAATVMASTVLSCTSRSASEESELAEPDIAVVPDLAPSAPHGEVRLVDGLLSTKRLPAAGFRALTDLLVHRDKSRSRLYDRAIKELVKVACEHDEPTVSAVIDGSTIEEIYPLDRVRDADAAGCGVLFVNGRKVRGALFENGCFGLRLAAAMNAQGGEYTFDKCSVSPTEPHRVKPSAAVLGSGSGSGAALVGSGSGSGSGAALGSGSGSGSGAALGSGSGSGSATVAPAAGSNNGSAAGSATANATRG